MAEAVRALTSSGPAVLFLGDRTLRADGLSLADRISARTGARLLAQVSNARMERGAGRVAIERLPYPVDLALGALKDVRHLVVVGTTEPVAFFAYPGKPSRLAPEGCQVTVLARPQDDQIDALERLADALRAAEASPPAHAPRPDLPSAGALGPDTLALALGALLPEGRHRVRRIGDDGPELLSGNPLRAAP